MAAPPAVKLTRPPLPVAPPHRLSPSSHLRSLPTPKLQSRHTLSPGHLSSFSSISALSSLSALHSPRSLDSPRADALSRSAQPSRARCLRAPRRTSIRAAWGSDRRADGSAGSAVGSSSRHRRPGTVAANGEAATNFAETSATVTGVVPARRVFRGEADRESAQRLREEQLRERALRMNGFLERDAEALVVREARPEEYWEAADVHCAAFFPHAPFPLNYILRMDRVSAILANLSMPRGTYKKCLVAFDSPAFLQSLPPSSASSDSSASSASSSSPSTPTTTTTTSTTIAPMTKARSLPPEHVASAAIKDFDGERDLFGGPMFRPVLATMLLGPPLLSWTFSGLNVGPRGLVGSVTVDTAGEFLPRRKPHNRRRTGIAYISNMADEEEEGDAEEEDAVRGKAERRGGRSRGGGGAAEGASTRGMAGEEAEEAEGGGGRKGKSSRIKLNLKGKASGVCRLVSSRIVSFLPCSSSSSSAHIPHSAVPLPHPLAGSQVARHRRVLPSVVEAAVIALHMRRITVLEFHAVRDDVLLSGDKVRAEHRPTCDEVVLSSSLDGKVCRVDIDTAQATVLANLNPLGWQGDQRTWGSFYAMDAPARDGGATLVAGDNFGCIHFGAAAHHNPVLAPTCAPVNASRQMHLWDVRQLSPQHRIASIQHPRVVNSAYFSPITGTWILSTCQDNRLRVWDSVFGDLQRPTTTIVHSHDFNRYLSPFKAHWDPKDDAERVVVCGRYISDDYSGVALHPIDFLDASSGALLGSAVDPHLTTISPVNLPHPRCDLLATGSSSSAVDPHLTTISPVNLPHPRCDLLATGSSSLPSLLSSVLHTLLLMPHMQHWCLRSVYLWTVPEDAEEGEGEATGEASQQGYGGTGSAGQQQAVLGNRGTIRMFNADIWGRGGGRGKTKGKAKEWDESDEEEEKTADEEEEEEEEEEDEEDEDEEEEVVRSSTKRSRSRR
ncbi:unnamed protein product [Closterium sp. Yama58-4]|nr:unnamed protein product [Closterium sp. Yama58-4]